MRLHLFAPALSLALVCTSQSEAGLNLGMKLACKRYGDAWNSGSRSAVMGATTGDFAQQWARMPAEAFASLPRGGSGQVLSSSKSGNCGYVTVASNMGVVTFRLVGAGFNWTVDDIHKPGDDGQMVSMKNYLDCTLTAGEFIADLKNRGGSSFHDSITPEFASAFKSLSKDELNLIRGFLPEIQIKYRPYVVMNGNRATMRVRIPTGGPDETVVFRMTRMSSWRVDDYQIDTAGTQIASFRSALPVLATMIGFGEFSKDPTKIDPDQIAVGPIRDELTFIRSQGKFPVSESAKRKQLVISPDLKMVTMHYPNRTVRMHIVADGSKRKIAKIDAGSGDVWSDVGRMMAMRRQISSLSFAVALLRGPAQESEQVFANAVALEQELNPAASATPAPKPALTDSSTVPAVATRTGEIPEPAKLASAQVKAEPRPAAPVVQRATYTYPTHQYSNRPVRRFGRRCR